MGMNYEFERNIQEAERAGNTTGANLLRAQRNIFNGLRNSEVISELPRESISSTQAEPSTVLSEAQQTEILEAAKLEQEHGFTFDRMPDDVYPGKPYITVGSLVAQEATLYTQQTINRQTRTGKLPFATLVDTTVLFVEGVKRLFTREEYATKDVSPARRPGKR